MSGIDADFHQDTKLDSTIRINTSGVGTTMMAESNKDYLYVTCLEKKLWDFQAALEAGYGYHIIM